MVPESPKEVRYSQQYVDELINNSSLLKEIITEKDEEIEMLSKRFDKWLNDLVKEQDKNREYSAQFNKSKNLIQKCLDVFDELKADYSLPDDITESIDRIQDVYFDLFIESNDPSHKSVNKDLNADEPLNTGTVSSEILESYDEYLPVKDNELEISHM